MKNLFIGFLAIFSIFISACSTSQPMWRKEGVTPYDTKNSFAKCRYEIGMAKISQDERAELVSHCMESNGFRYR